MQHTRRSAGGLVPGLALGAGAAYFLDPQAGGRRRALVRDQVVHWRRRATDAIDVATRDFANRARGLVAEMRGALQRREASDHVVAERCRAKLGAAVEHPGAVTIVVRDGRATLAGDVLEHEHRAVVDTTRTVRGVHSVEDQLSVHAEPDGVPALQGEGRARRGTGKTTPATNLVATIAGAFGFLALCRTLMR
jgi:hypothetical protein